MKKIISLVLCLILGSFILSGCSNNSEPFEEKSYTSDTQIHEINLDVQDRDCLLYTSQKHGMKRCYRMNTLKF